MNRRTVVVSLGTASLTAGCLGGFGGTERSGTTDEERDGNETKDDEDGEKRTHTVPTESELEEMISEMTEVDYQTRHFARTHDTPTWAESEPRPYGHLELYGSAEDAREGLPFETVADGRDDEIKSFIDETGFRDSRLLYVVAVGLGTSDLTTEVQRLGIYAGKIVGTATIRNGDEGDSMDMYASSLVRATPNGDAPVPDRAVLSITSYSDRAGVADATSDRQ